MMRITIEREIRPGLVKSTVVQLRDAGNGKVSILGSIPGKPDVPGTLIFTDRVKGGSYTIALQALRALAGEVPVQRGEVEQEKASD